MNLSKLGFWAFAISLMGTSPILAGDSSGGGINPFTLDLSCEFQAPKGGDTYRLKIQTVRGGHRTLSLFRKDGAAWIDLDKEVNSIRPTQSFYRFAGITFPGSKLEENKRIDLTYYWNGPSDEPARFLSLNFNAAQRSALGSYPANLALKTNSLHLMPELAAVTCYADVTPGSDPYKTK